MPSTVFQNLPYPSPTDPVDVPGDIQALAEALDTKMLDKAVIQAKGDLLCGLADNTVTTVSVGSDKSVLVADSTVSTVGMKWDYVGVPTGVVNPFAGSVAPSGWLLCEGQAVSRTAYAALYAVLSTTYGAGDGSTTFNLPNMKGKVPVGLDSAQTEFDVRGETGGAKTHTLASTEMPSHTHTQTGHSHSGGSHSHTGSGTTSITSVGDHTHRISEAQIGVASGSAGTTFRTDTTNIGWNTGSGGGHSHTASTSVSIGTASVTTDSQTPTIAATGGGGAHNNLQPYIVLNYIIKT